MNLIEIMSDSVKSWFYGFSRALSRMGRVICGSDDRKGLKLRVEGELN